MTDMYNKLFTKILDSSIWSESVETRIVWLTFIAAMDEEGMVRFASPENVSHRARVTLEAAKKAIEVLEGPDENSSDQDNEGRRLERVPGGWMVLNGKKYRGMVTKSVIQEQTRERVRRYREKKAGNVTVTPVTLGNDSPIAIASAPDSDSAVEQKRKMNVFKPTCPSCGVVGSLQRSPGNRSYPAGWWCRNLKSKTFKGDGCGENFPLDTPEIVEKLSPFQRSSLEKVVPQKTKAQTTEDAVREGIRRAQENVVLRGVSR